MNTVTSRRSICTLCSSSSHICALFGFSCVQGDDSLFPPWKVPIQYK